MQSYMRKVVGYGCLVCIIERKVYDSEWVVLALDVLLSVLLICDICLY